MAKHLSTYNDDSGIGWFEEHNEENGYSPYCMTTETQKCVTLESEWKFNLKLLCVEELEDLFHSTPQNVLTL